eukprot:Seg1065.2 transcript_id=Seg1065.2/GoldUCD/mRNA.D3Y31 product="Protein ADP-ribosylarginine hydrolase" protein_id=Seg1065.2/GoldUCD/D3Y31
MADNERLKSAANCESEGFGYDSMKERYQASMVLAGVGDALGYRNGKWEFNLDGCKIHEELEAMGGLSKLTIKPNGWKISDDTVLLLATATGLIAKYRADDEELFADIASRYKKEMFRDMAGRSPGVNTREICGKLRPLRPDGYRVPFNPKGGGCGAAMRAMCIGLRYPDTQNDSSLDKLIKVSVETGRMTHHHPTGYLGAFASALFTSLAISLVPVKKWGCILLKLLSKAQQYIKDSGYSVKENLESWSYFKTSWEKFLELREISNGESEPKFPIPFGVKERETFYRSFAFRNSPGSSGHDAPMIAYDALLAAGSNWEKLCHHAMLHGGDNDSTGVIAGACFGAMYGFEGVPKCNYEHVEYHEKLSKAGRDLYKIAFEDSVSQT